jgi:lipopolysaccharide transport system permease protein
MSSPLPVHVIVPHSGIEGFRHACGSLFTRFPQAWALAWRFFLRDTRASHRQSLLGYFWIFFPPLVNTLVWVMLNKSNVIRIDSGSVPYPLFVLTGTVLWAAFNGAIMAAMAVVGDARGVLAKVNFPHESLVYTAFLKSLVDACIAAFLLLPALLIYQVPFHAGLVLFPFAIMAALLLGLAIGLILVPIASLYSDVGRAAQLALRFGFFITPVIFPLPTEGLARTLMCLNPITPVIVSGRAWLAGSGEAMPVSFFAVLSASILLITVGLLFFKVAMPRLIERLSS